MMIVLEEDDFIAATIHSSELSGIVIPFEYVFRKPKLHILKFSIAVLGFDLLCFGGCMMIVLEEDDCVRWLCDGLDFFFVSFRYVSKEDEDDGVILWICFESA
nr:hypothetical protein [Tanacetum cinerariifolium]